MRIGKSGTDGTFSAVLIAQSWPFRMIAAQAPTPIQKLSATCTSTGPPTSCPRVPPPAIFQPTFAPMPRPPAPLTSSAAISSQPSAADSAYYRFFTPLFSASSELLFCQLLCFHEYLRCPLVFSARAFRFSRIKGTTCRNPRGFNALRALSLSLRSFPHPRPFFSIACSLFYQKQGVGYA